MFLLQRAQSALCCGSGNAEPDPATCRQALCGQPCSLPSVAEGGGCHGPKGTHEQSPLDVRSKQNIHLCSDKALWLGVPYRTVTLLTGIIASLFQLLVDGSTPM